MSGHSKTALRKGTLKSHTIKRGNGSPSRNTNVSDQEEDILLETAFSLPEKPIPCKPESNGPESGGR